MYKRCTRKGWGHPYLVTARATHCGPNMTGWRGSNCPRPPAVQHPSAATTVAAHRGRCSATSHPGGISPLLVGGKVDVKLAIHELAPLEISDRALCRRLGGGETRGEMR